MKFRLLILIFFFTLSCDPQLTTINQKQPYASKGFAYIYNNSDFKNKIIKARMNNEKMQISHQNLKTGTLIKITNPQNNESLVLKNFKRIKYPDFYKILITEAVAKKLNIKSELPILEIIEIKKNKSFVAEKAKIYKEEKKISSKAPVASVQISNISKNKNKKVKKLQNKIYIHIASFYSINTAEFMKKRITNEIPGLNQKKLKIQKINSKENKLISGPYTSVNLLKNDYIKLKSFGFEELDIYLNE
tara:strand:- start:3221 stop:3961 length:741 start_codon:yes stop_codon:yes gene_type:complete